MFEQIIEIKKNKYIVRSIIPKEWVSKDNYNYLTQKYNGTKILKDNKGTYFVGDLIQEVTFIEIIENNNNLIKI